MIARKDQARASKSASTGPLAFTLPSDPFDFIFKRSREPVNQTQARPSPNISQNAPAPSMPVAESIASQQLQQEVVCVSRQDEPRSFVLAFPPEKDEIVAFAAVTIRVDLASDGRIRLTVLTFSETFAYDSSTRAWSGDRGSHLIGGSDLFDQRTGWTITVWVCNAERSSVSISHGGQYKQGTINGLSLKRSSDQLLRRP